MGSADVTNLCNAFLARLPPQASIAGTNSLYEKEKMRASIWHLLVAAAPVVGILVYVSQGNRQDTILRQERSEMQQRLEKTEFDRDFSAAWNGAPLAADASALEKIKALEAKRDDLDRQLAAGMSSAESDLADLRRQLEK